MQSTKVTERLTSIYRAARHDPEFCVLEGLHAVKHGLRFGADFRHMHVNRDMDWQSLVVQLAPDILSQCQREAQELSQANFFDLAPQPPHTGIIAIAKRPPFDAKSFWTIKRAGPVVLLDHPAHPGNTGAVIRTAAAAGASAVFSIGPEDPWHATTIRAAAGLHFALTVNRLELDELPNLPMTGLDAHGDPIIGDCISANSILVFGSERRGISSGMRQQLDSLLALPMQQGVSSLNLAASVAALLYHWRLRATIS